MNEKTHNGKVVRSNTKSSMSISREIVCEGEACIGKGAAPENASGVKPTKAKDKSKKSQGTSMAIGGEVICTDDACIAKE